MADDIFKYAADIHIPSMTTKQLEIYEKIKSKDQCVELMGTMGMENLNEILDMCNNMKEIIINNTTVKFPGNI